MVLVCSGLPKNTTTTTMPNGFDRIFKENIDAMVAVFLYRFFGLEWERADPLKDKLQITLERETDFLLHLDKGDKSRERIVHLEFQVKSGRLLDLRMLTYNVMLQVKYRCPVVQAVIFLQKAPKKPRKRRWIKQPGLTFSYPVFYVHKLPFEELIRSDIPEEIVLAVLSDFGDLGPEEAVKVILKRLEALSGETFSTGKYVQQLRVLSNLRSLNQIVHEQLEQMPSIFTKKFQQDVLYLRGKDEGIAEG